MWIIFSKEVKGCDNERRANNTVTSLEFVESVTASARSPKQQHWLSGNGSSGSSSGPHPLLNPPHTPGRTKSLSLLTLSYQNVCQITRESRGRGAWPASTTAGAWCYGEA